MNLVLTALDEWILAAYFLVLMGIGFAFYKKPLADDQYLLGARRLTLPFFVMSLVTTWYGAILGVGEFVFNYGLVAWVSNGLFWYLVYVGFALVLAERLQKTQKTTVAEQFLDHAGPWSAKWAAAMTFIMSSPAPYVLSLSLIFQGFLNWSWGEASAAALGISALYIWLGGFKAVIRTDAFQFIFMFVGFGALTVMAWLNLGSPMQLPDLLPAAHLTFKGELPWQTLAVWGVLALWPLVDPSFYQRCYAAYSPRTAKKGVLWAILFWMIFDAMTLLTGLYARAYFPQADPQMAYFALSGAVLPAGLNGLFLVGILSIVMSTVDAFLFASSSVLAVDILKKSFPTQSLKTLTRLGIVLTLGVSAILMLEFESVIGLIYALGTVGVSTLLWPLLLIILKKTQFKDAYLSVNMLLTGCVSGLWLWDGWDNAYEGWPVYQWGLEPMVIGLAVSGFLLGLHKLYTLYGNHFQAKRRSTSSL